ncbi:ABC transporter permease [Variovorax sp. J22P240]|uniref:ABC transporter permease n=1 Tax=unclassified Variovorax TaxID=663243 RepID=UPI002575AC66|nr:MULTISPECIES: ABC transporter permease [unclassified Variovorax]MDM0002067.1 ABC transporter permease [Variovorax sp. J22P240]MDM0052260.1 ABC transporter permease [Variovorax sp. J22R115]
MKAAVFSFFGGAMPIARRLFSRKVVLAAALVLLLVVGVAVIYPWISDADPGAIEISNRLHAPSWTHWAGTDELGRDVMLRIVHGARYSLMIGFVTAAGAVLFGTLMGMLAGFFRKLDAPLMRVVDAMMSFPDILLGIALVSILGVSLWNVMLALVIVYTPRVARVVRATTLVLRELLFVDAARALGVRTPRILRKHILPNLMSPILVQVTFIFAYAILAEAGLSFLGVGVPPDIPTWGTMIAGSLEYADKAFWTIFCPGLAIVLTALSLQMLGDGVRDLLDPKLRKAA